MPCIAAMGQAVSEATEIGSVTPSLPQSLFDAGIVSSITLRAGNICMDCRVSFHFENSSWPLAISLGDQVNSPMRRKAACARQEAALSVTSSRREAAVRAEEDVAIPGCLVGTPRVPAKPVPQQSGGNGSHCITTAGAHTKWLVRVSGAGSAAAAAAAATGAALAGLGPAGGGTC
jgi:hypothetical protein